MKILKSKNIINLFVLSFILVSVSTSCAQQEKQVSADVNQVSVDTTEKVSEFKWYSFDEGMKKAKAENKYIILDFYADWCKWCTVMEEKTYLEESVLKFIEEKYVPIQIDTEANETLTYEGKTYTNGQFSAAVGVTGLPTTAWLNPKGEFLTTLSGYIKAPQFIDIIGYVADGSLEKKIKFADWTAEKHKDDKKH